MATFETIVRPVIFPNIRPAQVRPVAPESDPEKGFAHIHGASGTTVSLSSSWSVNTSRSKQQEVKRRVDEVRVFKMDDEGNVEEDTWIDLYLTNKLWLREPGASGGINSSTGGGTPAVGSAYFDSQVYLQKAKEKPNVRVRQRNLIIPNDDLQG
jgi:hypothetical protein